MTRGTVPFSVAERAAVRDELIARAAADERIVACALVGSSASGEDRWSDIDLTLAVGPPATVADALADWTAHVETAYAATTLFDIVAGPSTYRVFLLPTLLQVDVSFTPAADFGATGRRFRLVFGEQRPRAAPPGRPIDDLVGLAVHHALRARICIERKRRWQAEHWLSELRNEALRIACRARGLPESYGRGYDDLPADLLASAAGALPRELDTAGLRRALRAAVDLLLAVARDVSPLAATLESRLADIAADWAS